MKWFLTLALLAGCVRDDYTPTPIRKDEIYRVVSMSPPGSRKTVRVQCHGSYCKID